MAIACRWLERRNCAFGIAFVTPLDIGQDRGLARNLAEAAHLDSATLCPDLRRSGHKNLGVRKRANDGPDVAPVENGTGQGDREILLQSQ